MGRESAARTKPAVQTARTNPTKLEGKILSPLSNMSLLKTNPQSPNRTSGAILPRTGGVILQQVFRSDSFDETRVSPCNARFCDTPQNATRPPSDRRPCMFLGTNAPLI
jgi:hypothetical protein